VKNEILKKIEENRNQLRYLTTDPFEIPPFQSFINFFKDTRCTIINKKEDISEETKKYVFKVKRNKVKLYILIDISKDHLIKIRIMPKNIKLTTRYIKETLTLIEESLNG